MSLTKLPNVRFVFNMNRTATKSSAKDAKKGSVSLEVSFRQQRRYISTGVRVYADEWKGVYPNFIVKCAEGSLLNDRIKLLLHNVEAVINEMCANSSRFDFDEFVDKVRNEEEKNMSFLEWCRTRIRERESSGDLAPLTAKAYRSCISLLEKSGGVREFGDLTARNIVKFDDYLRSIGERQTTIYKQHKRLKVFVHEAIVMELIKKNPYDRIRLHSGKPLPKQFLTPEEVALVRDTYISNRWLAKVRDLMVFQMFTGLAYCDLMRFNDMKVVEEDGQYVVRDVRQKSHEEFMLVLLSPAVDVLKRFEFKLPIISNQKYNDDIKLICSKCGINKVVTSHDLRRTFATCAYSLGADIRSIQRMMGHSQERQTMEYISVLGEDVKDDARKLDERINRIKRARAGFLRAE